MTPQRHEQVKRLFLAACELSEAERSAFLEQACGDDQELREEVDSLLRHHHPATIIEQPDVRGRASPAVPPASAGQQGTPETSAEAVEDQGRFAAGTIFAQRYRIVGLLGRGGMGEVYRADDLRLHRQVALKFLPRSRIGDAAWLARFRNEVRTALTVTHPNICRVYDIGEAEGEVFISMECIDGENLALLLRRIGRLPSEKAIQICRQICFGLAAAHSRGILHRDLKPENVMLDGRGDAHITDFGIAVPAAPERQGRTLIGTPTYMAPELFSGRPAAAASDIFSLGALIYEIVTGHKAFDSESIVRDGRHPTIIPPSRWVGDIDPAMERLILQCLADDPQERPASVMQVLAAIPGTDPLLAVVAAGELPSPELVASARAPVARRPLLIAVAACAMAGLAIIVALADRTFLLPQAGLARPPAVLEDKAREIIRRLQKAEGPVGHPEGFFVDPAGLEWNSAHADRGRPWRQTLSNRQTSPLYFDYQTGITAAYARGPLQRPRLRARVTAGLSTGATVVRLDPQGRLLAYSEILKRPIPDDPAQASPDWAVAFDLAGLRLDDFQAVPPDRQPPLFANIYGAWQEIHPRDPETPIRVEAAAVHDRVVFFEVVKVWDWPEPGQGAAQAAARAQMIASQARYILFIVTLAGAVALAKRNLHLGRGDRRGAGRVALFMFCLVMSRWLVQPRQTIQWLTEMESFLWDFQYSVFGAVLIWCYYIGMEPYVRRFWPQSIISWSRLLLGRARDPLVGRDLLVGVLVGVGIVLLQQLNVLWPTWARVSRTLPLLPRFGYELGDLEGSRYQLHTLIGVIQAAVWLGLVFLMLMLLARVVLRIRLLSALGFLAVATAICVLAFETTSSVSWITNAIIAVGVAITLVHVGLLATIVGLLVSLLLTNVPMTSDIRCWYGGSAVFALLITIALLVSGVYLSSSRARQSRATRTGG